MSINKMNRITRVTQPTFFGEVVVEISIHNVAITLPGYGTKTAYGDDPIVIVDYSGEVGEGINPKVLIWGDINEEDPTSRVSIGESAKHEARREN